MSSKRRSSSDLPGSSLQEKRSRISRSASDNSHSDKSKKSLENWGIIESISLKNFMCHSRLTMSFSSTVNFIVGRNGSGKSAVLTGLIVGLGGKASSTNRGTSLKTLIKTGSNSASVEITLRNNGDDPIKPDVYGSKIIVERRITSDGTSSYKIKNSSRKVISNKKEDLVSILDEINLHVDNPLTCLNQEMSKNFLHTKNESDKYKFFLKATQLEQMHRDYRFIQEQEIHVKRVLDTKEKVIPDLEKEVLEKEHRFKNLATLRELKKKIENLKSELAWSYVAQLEHSWKSFKKELDRESLRTPKYDTALKKCLENEQKAQKKFDEQQKKIKEHQQQIKLLEPDKRKAKESLYQAKLDYKSSENALSRAKKQMRDTQKDRSEMTARIEELKTSAKIDLEEERRKREENLACRRDRESQLQAKLKTTSHQCEQFSLAIEQSKDKMSSTHQEVAELTQQFNKVKHKLSDLTTGANRKNKLHLFGAKMPEFVKRIDELHQNCKFREKPRGPMGSCVTLKDPAMAFPVECAIKGSLHSFVVDNHYDEKVLEKLRNSLFSENERSRIVIYTVRFSDRFYDVSAGKACHNKYHSVLDLLNIEDPVVANCLIDMNHIESVLVIPDTQDALKTMQGPHPPRNCSRAYTKFGDEVFKDRFYSSQSKDNASKYLRADVEGEIQRNRVILQEVTRKLGESRQELSASTNEMKRNQQEFLKHDRTKGAIMVQVRNIRTEIRELEDYEEPQPLDVKDLEDEVINYTQQISSINTVVEGQTERLEELKQLKDEKQAALTEVLNKMKEIAEDAEEIGSEVNKASNELEKAKSDKVHFLEGKKKHEDVIKKIEGELAEKEKSMKEEIEKATIICKDKVVTRRTPNNLVNEIRQVNMRISSEENEHGNHELIVKEYNEARETFSEIKRRIRWSRTFLKQIDTYLEKRNVAYKRIRKIIAMRCCIDFEVLLHQRGFVGKLNFDHSQQELQLSVKPHDNASQSKDLRALSGGERSFSTVCYVLALWQAIGSPLRCLDEFDVFMDMANRRVAMEMMVEMAVMQHMKQFIFLTPHDISALPKSPRLNVWKMPDPDRSQTHLPFEPVEE